MDAATAPAAALDGHFLTGDPCQNFHPRFLIPCSLPSHPNKVSHHATGEHEGTRWTMFWWDVAAQHDRPEARSDGAPIPLLAT